MTAYRVSNSGICATIRGPEHMFMFYNWLHCHHLALGVGSNTYRRALEDMHRETVVLDLMMLEYYGRCIHSDILWPQHYLRHRIAEMLS